MSKSNYLAAKLKKTTCPEVVKCKKNKATQCGTCFWNNITLPFEKIPECRNCREDYLFKRENKDNKGWLDDYRDKCCSFCLWHDWFQLKLGVDKSDKQKIIKTI